MIEKLPRIFTTAVSWNTLAVGAEASFLGKALREGYISFYRKEGSKRRLLYRSGGIYHKELDQKIARVIRKRVNAPNRIKQSREDVGLVEQGNYRYLISMDLKKAFYTNNLLMILFINFLITPRLILKIFIPSFILFQSNSMKAGLSSSLFLLGLCFKNWGNLLPGKHKTQIYVDDLVIATNSRRMGQVLILWYQVVFGVMGFRWHTKEKFSFVDLEAKPKVALERLGLVIGYRKNGKVYSKVRGPTIKKYHNRIKQILRDESLRDEVKIKLVSRVLYNGTFSFHKAFPNEILRGDAQSRRFYAQVARSFRKYANPTLSNREIFKIIKNQRLGLRVVKFCHTKNIPFVHEKSGRQNELHYSFTTD